MVSGLLGLRLGMGGEAKAQAGPGNRRPALPLDWRGISHHPASSPGRQFPVPPG